MNLSRLFRKLFVIFFAIPSILIILFLSFLWVIGLDYDEVLKPFTILYGTLLLCVALIIIVLEYFDIFIYNKSNFPLYSLLTPNLILFEKSRKFLIFFVVTIILIISGVHLIIVSLQTTVPYEGKCYVNYQTGIRKIPYDYIVRLSNNDYVALASPSYDKISPPASSNPDYSINSSYNIECKSLIKITYIKDYIDLHFIKIGQEASFELK